MEISLMNSSAVPPTSTSSLAPSNTADSSNPAALRATLSGWLSGSAPLFSLVQADGTGAMPPIFLNPEQIYRVQLYNAAFSLIEDVDPYVPAMPVTGNGQLILNAQGEMTISAPIP